jgi:cytochrome c-type biogenesis protein CcmH/NrfF
MIRNPKIELLSPAKNIDVGMVPKQEEILRIFQGQKRHQVISSSYYSNAEYLNESRVLQMVCTCYLDARDCTDFTIANPIYEGQAKTLWYKIKEMLNVYSDDNQQICNDLQNIKERLILTTDELNTSDINKAICEYLLKKYGNSVKYHDDVYKKFIQFERSYSELRSAVQQKGTVDDSQTELARFQVDSHSLLEEVF